MLPEQQQRILGYFIEEAKDHLDTIEKGLLNLQSTLDNPEMINEVFRAAHSIKGGAAMLGMSSIQHTAHRLEDYFKVLKQHPIQVDQKLESLFLGVSDTLKALLESCTEPSGLTDEMAQTLMSETEPVFKWLQEHLDLLVEESRKKLTENISILAKVSPATLPQTLPQRSESLQNLQTVQSQVIRILREMLQLFKQTATPQTRQSLYKCCDELAELGEEFNWSNWCSLCRTAGSAIAFPQNTYLTLAKTVITDLKQALELVIAGKETEITISQQLQALIRVEQTTELLEKPLILAGESDSRTELLELPPVISSSTLYLEYSKEIAQTTSNATYTSFLDIAQHDRITSLSELSEQFNSNDNPPLTHTTDTKNQEQEVTRSNLNLLADFFEGDSLEDQMWDKEEILEINAEDKLKRDVSNDNTEETNNVLEKLIDKSTIRTQQQAIETEEDTLLFYDDLLEDNLESDHQTTSHLTEELTFEKKLAPQDIAEIVKTPLEQFVGTGEKIQDKVTSLLELLLDENQQLYTGQINQRQTETIANIELSKKQESSSHDLSLESIKAKLIEARDYPLFTNVKTISDQDEILTLEDLFIKTAEDNIIGLPGEKSTSYELKSSQIEIENFNKFWELELKGKNDDLSPADQQHVASELEEILLATAAEDFFYDVVNQSKTSTLDSLMFEDSELNLNMEEQQLDLLFLSESDDDWFQKLTLNIKESSSIDTTIGTQSTSIVSQIDLSLFSQQPEAVELAPEFTILSLEAENKQELVNNGFLTQELQDINLRVNSECSHQQPEIINTEADLDGDNFLQLDSALDVKENLFRIEAVDSEDELTQEIDIFLNGNLTELDELLSEEVVSEVNAELRSEERTAQGKLLGVAANQVTSDRGKKDLPPRPFVYRTTKFEQLIKVPVKHLDDLSNLVGELVVNRNTLEQDQQRLRQFLDNLLLQMQQLSNVGARMQELYERSLLDASVNPNRSHHSDDYNKDIDRGLTKLEMDQFSPFHTLSQEMIELIVRVREAASDIDFVTEDTEGVARQFRQVTNQLQEGIMRSRMEPFAEVTTPLERGVRESAIKCGKQAQLVIEGRETLIDKVILEHLKTPLTHLLNNAIAHGIETPDIRQAIGKPPVGVITVRAFHQGNQTVISISDDGAGIDIEAVKAKAIKIGIITPEQAKSLSRHHVYDLLFQPGFSTKEKEDELAGRGIGLDVVLARMSEMRGKINIHSTLGGGTTFTICLPLTLSICKALCCISDKARIAFPMDGVEDTLDVPVKNIQQNSDGQKYIPWRNTLLPLQQLKEILTVHRQLSRGSIYGGHREDDMICVVVVRSANVLLALQVDQVLNEQEIVIKQFEGPLPKPIGVAGATILGDGRIMPIADVMEIIDIFQGRTSKQRSASLCQQQQTPSIQETAAVEMNPTVLIVDDSITVRELLSLTFSKAGYRVEQARDGQEAWDKLRCDLPCDIVFCDIEMPRCDGLELLSRIQKNPNLKHLPIAMLTSRGAQKHRQMAIQMGASGYFTKPYLEEVLLEAASRMLKGEKLVD
ncbi:MAG: response regulator [Brasilonema octagenarum HA4186-MV1]|jgi:chemosensory pili system protein ChpA (sensor histidine kinase/response regulator)|nr:response regulator [Brasilonema octagenarum HA4186-MV1]